MNYWKLQGIAKNKADQLFRQFQGDLEQPSRPIGDLISTRNPLARPFAAILKNPALFNLIADIKSQSKNKENVYISREQITDLLTKEVGETVSNTGGIFKAALNEFFNAEIIEIDSNDLTKYRILPDMNFLDKARKVSNFALQESTEIEPVTEEPKEPQGFIEATTLDRLQQQQKEYKAYTDWENQLNLKDKQALLDVYNQIETENDSQKLNQLLESLGGDIEKNSQYLTKVWEQRTKAKVAGQPQAQYAQKFNQLIKPVLDKFKRQALNNFESDRVLQDIIGNSGLLQGRDLSKLEVSFPKAGSKPTPHQLQAMAKLLGYAETGGQISYIEDILSYDLPDKFGTDRYIKNQDIHWFEPEWNKINKISHLKEIVDYYWLRKHEKNSVKEKISDSVEFRNIQRKSEEHKSLLPPPEQQTALPAPDTSESITDPNETFETFGIGPTYKEVKSAVIKHQNASMKFFKETFQMGDLRIKKFLKALEKEGIVQRGKPRNKVLVSSLPKAQPSVPELTKPSGSQEIVAFSGIQGLDLTDVSYDELTNLKDKLRDILVNGPQDPRTQYIGKQYLKEINSAWFNKGYNDTVDTLFQSERLKGGNFIPTGVLNTIITKTVPFGAMEIGKIVDELEKRGVTRYNQEGKVKLALEELPAPESIPVLKSPTEVGERHSQHITFSQIMSNIFKTTFSQKRNNILLAKVPNNLAERLETNINTYFDNLESSLQNNNKYIETVKQNVRLSLTDIQNLLIPALHTQDTIEYGKKELPNLNWDEIEEFRKKIGVTEGFIKSDQSIDKKSLKNYIEQYHGPDHKRALEVGKPLSDFNTERRTSPVAITIGDSKEPKQQPSEQSVVENFQRQTDAQPMIEDARKSIPKELSSSPENTRQAIEERLRQNTEERIKKAQEKRRQSRIGSGSTEGLPKFELKLPKGASYMAVIDEVMRQAMRTFLGRTPAGMALQGGLQLAEVAAKYVKENHPEVADKIKETLEKAPLSVLPKDIVEKIETGQELVQGYEKDLSEFVQGLSNNLFGSSNEEENQEKENQLELPLDKLARGGFITQRKGIQNAIQI